MLRLSIPDTTGCANVRERSLHLSSHRGIAPGIALTCGSRPRLGGIGSTSACRTRGGTLHQLPRAFRNWIVREAGMPVCMASTNCDDAGSFPSPSQTAPAPPQAQAYPPRPWPPQITVRRAAFSSGKIVRTGHKMFSQLFRLLDQMRFHAEFQGLMAGFFEERAGRAPHRGCGRPCGLPTQAAQKGGNAGRWRRKKSCWPGAVHIRLPVQD